MDRCMDRQAHKHTLYMIHQWTLFMELDQWLHTIPNSINILIIIIVCPFVKKLLKSLINFEHICTA